MPVPSAASKRPDASAFKQQTLKAWRPILTPRLVILLFSVVGTIFVPIGGIILSISNQVCGAPRAWQLLACGGGGGGGGGSRRRCQTSAEKRARLSCSGHAHARV